MKSPHSTRLSRVAAVLPVIALMALAGVKQPTGLASDSFPTGISRSTAKGLSAQVGSVPRAGGEVVRLAASPNGKQVAFVAANGEERPTLGLYDLSTRRLLTQERINEEFNDLQLTWSRDSRYVGLRDPGDFPFLIDQSGQRHSLPNLPPSAGNLVWRVNRPDSFVYVGEAEGGDGLYEYQLGTGKIRLLRRVKRLGLDLQLVDRKPCFVELEQGAPQTGRWVRVKQVENAQEVFRLWLPRQAGPVPDPAEWDGPAVSVSPDRRYFHAGGRVSASNFSILGWVRDAPTVFKKPRIAAAYAAGLVQSLSVKWVERDGRTTWALLRDSSSEELFAIVDPETGARYEARFPSVRLLEFLPNGDQIGTTPLGLALNRTATLGWNPEYLLLASTPPHTR